MTDFFQGKDEKVHELSRYEHFRKGNVGGKIVVPYYYDAGSDTLTPASQPGLLPFEFDDMQFTNADANGNYQTITVKNNTATVATLTLTYDESSKLTGITRA